MNGAEISNYAGRFADEAVQILDVEGVHKSVVMVTQGYATGYPLSIGTPRNSGFGMEDEIYGDTYRDLFPKLLKTAQMQAEYSLRVGGRTAEQQLAKLNSNKRLSSSYGIDIPALAIPSFYCDPITGLTVTVVGELLPPMWAAEISQRAVEATHNKTKSVMNNASELANLCLENASKQLPDDRTAFALIALSEPREDGPVVVCSRSLGKNKIEPVNFAIVKAKINETALSGKPSGLEGKFSQIEGAVRVSLVGGGMPRVIGVGGLEKGSDDVAAIQKAIEEYSIKDVDRRSFRIG